MSTPQYRILKACYKVSKILSKFANPLYFDAEDENYNYGGKKTYTVWRIENENGLSPYRGEAWPSVQDFEKFSELDDQTKPTPPEEGSGFTREDMSDYFTKGECLHGFLNVKDAFQYFTSAQWDLLDKNKFMIRAHQARKIRFGKGQIFFYE